MSTSILEVTIASDRIAVGVLVHYLDVAAKRGAFALEESGKIMEAVTYLRGPAVDSRPEGKVSGEKTLDAKPKKAPAKPRLN